MAPSPILNPSQTLSRLSYTLSKQILLATVSLLADVFLFILEEHKCSGELLITAYCEAFSTLSFSFKKVC